MSAKDNLRAAWKEYPIRVFGPRLSRCHNKPTFLVQSMTGGFVTANCSECGNSATLSNDEFRDLKLWVGCPKCKGRMKDEILGDRNYGYRCERCRIEIILSDLLPMWSDLT